MLLNEIYQLAQLSIDSPWRARRNLRRIIEGPLIILWLRALGVEVGRGGRYFGRPIIQRYRGSVIKMGSDVILRSRRSSNVLGLAHPVMLTTLSRSARIELGRSVGVSGASLCAATGITVGDNVLIGADVLITDTDHHGLGVDGDRSFSGAASAPIFIGSGAFIGARAVILKGATIGENAIVGAGAVVTGAVRPSTIVAGNPAREVALTGPGVARPI